MRGQVGYADCGWSRSSLTGWFPFHCICHRFSSSVMDYHPWGQNNFAFVRVARPIEKVPTQTLSSTIRPHSNLSCVLRTIVKCPLLTLFTASWEPVVVFPIVSKPRDLQCYLVRHTTRGKKFTCPGSTDCRGTRSQRPMIHAANIAVIKRKSINAITSVRQVLFASTILLHPSSIWARGTQKCSSLVVG